MARSATPHSFSLDLGRYRLLDSERPVRLERQPMELLILLVKRQGDLVAREDIITALWSKDVHVDFDQSINRIVRKVRLALHDDPETPRFIETVVGKGYRFVGPIEIVGHPAITAPEPAVVERPTPSRFWKLTVAALIALSLAAGLAWRFIGRPPPQLPLSATVLTAYLGDEAFPSFSPDGRQVAFAWTGEQRNNWNIFTRQIDSIAPPMQLTTDAALDTMPAWSPDGREIAFVRQRGNEFGVYLSPALGGPERKLVEGLRTSADAPFMTPAWSPDGKYIVTVDFDLDRRTSHVVLISTGESGERRLLSSPDVDGTYAFPVVSPDGAALAYDWCHLANVCTAYVVALGVGYLPTGGPRAVTHDGHLARGLVWAPDGKSLIYGDGHRRGLFRVRLSDESLERVELAGPNTISPAVSRAGDRLAYTRSGKDWNIWKLGSGGTAPPVDFLSSTSLDTAATFSPDGKKIVFSSDRDGIGRQIWVANEDGSQPVALTSATGRLQGFPHWSPDGEWIAYDVRGEDGDPDIYLIAAAGGTPRRLTFNASDDYRPSWSQDGAWIYFSSTQAGQSDIWRMPVASGGRAERLTTTGGYDGREGRDGKTLYYMKTSHGALFARSLASSREHQIIDSVFGANFEVGDAGVYYIMKPDPVRLPYAFELRLFDLGTGRTVVMSRFDAIDVNGLSVSPDRQIVLSSGARRSVSDDLWLIRNFK